MVTKATVSFRIGRSFGKFDASSTSGSKFLSEQMMQEIAEDIAAVRDLDPADLERRLSAALSAEMAAAFQYAARQMVGLASPPDGGGAVKTFSIQAGGNQAGSKLTSNDSARPFSFRGKAARGGLVKWKALSSATVMKKRRFKSAGPRQFFVHTGMMRAHLLAIARTRSGFGKTGLVKVVEKENLAKTKKVKRVKGKILLQDLSIRVFPNLYSNDLPGLRSGNLLDSNQDMSFEKRIGITGETLKKLTGPQYPEHVNRPLLQPVVTYFTLFRFPQRVSTVFTQIKDSML